MERIKRKHETQFQKEALAAIWGAIIHHTVRARNWKLFKGVSVHTKLVITQVKKEVVHKIDLLELSRKSQKSSSLIHRLN